MSTPTPPSGRAGPADRPGPLHSLTGLRFVAALLVFLCHATLAGSYIPPYTPINPYADPDLAAALTWAFGTFGFIGVSFFFVLSGFVLTWSLRPGEPARAFLRRRILKIFPNHLVTWALAMVLFAAVLTPPSRWLPNLLLVHAFFPSPEFFLTVNVPSWTLSCELLFYLLFPLIVRPVRRIPQNRLWTWAGVLVVGMALVPVVGYLLLPDQPSYQGSPASVAQFWFGYFFPVPRLFEFVLGMVLARIVLSGRWLPLGIAPAAGLMLLGYAAVQVVPFLFKFTVATILPIGALICAAAAADHRGAPSVLRGRVMRWLGEVSFGLYICQGIVLFYGRWLLGPERVFDVPEATAVIAGLFLANLLAGWMLYVGVERPIMRRWSHPRRGTVVAPARKATAVGSAPEAAGAVATMAAPTGPSAAPPAELPTVSVVEPR